VPAPAASPGARLRSGLVALWLVGSVGFFIWVIQPLNAPLPATVFLVYIMLLAVGVNIRAGESPRDVGFRVDNLGRAARTAAPPTLALALLIGIAAVVVHGDPRPRAFPTGLVFYPLWGVTQQYALQGIVHRRLRRAGAGALASPLAAALFALVHAPNPGLVAMTFVGGWVWCEIYRRESNLWVLGISHGVLATLALALLPLRLTADLRIGPGYLRYMTLHRLQVTAPAPPTPLRSSAARFLLGAPVLAGGSAGRAHGRSGDVAHDRGPRAHVPAAHEAVAHVRVRAREGLGSLRGLALEEQDGHVRRIGERAPQHQLTPVHRLPAEAQVLVPEGRSALQVVGRQIVHEQEVHGSDPPVVVARAAPGGARETRAN
jgi:membrane protease YdiL (CAAX protease family)